MKTHTKIRPIMIISVLSLLLLFGLTLVYAGTSCEDGQAQGTQLEEEYQLEQDEYDEGADSLLFSVYHNNCIIKRYSITISKFTDSDCSFDGDHEVDVVAYGYTVNRNEIVDVDATLWLSGSNCCRNAMGYRNLQWKPVREGRQPEGKAIPDHYWSIDYPQEISGQPGQYKHTLTITNVDNQNTLKVSGLQFLYTMDFYEDLSQIVFTSPSYDFSLAPKQSWSIDVETPGSFIGGYIYFKRGVSNLEGSKVVFNAWTRHPVISRASVMPTLTQWGLIILAILVAGSGIWLMVRKRRVSSI